MVRLVLEKMAKATGDDDTLLGQVLDAIGPHLHYAGLGLLAHGVLRLAGSRRRAGSSVGVALFAGAGPAWLSQMITIAYFMAMMTFERTADKDAWGLVPNLVLAAIAIGTFLAFVATLCAGLSGLHGLHWAWVVLAVALALVASALVFGALPADVPGKYGLHLVLRLPIHGAKLGVGLRD